MLRFPIYIIFGLLFCVCATAPSLVFAQGLSDDEIEEFETLVTEAAVLKRDGDHEAAIERFEAASSINDHPRLQVEIASSQLALQHCDQAESTYEAILDRDDLRDDLRDSVQRRLRDLRPCPEEGRLSVGCSLSDETVVLRLLREDGAPSREDHCPIIWTVTPGDYTLVSQIRGAPSQTRDIVVRPGATSEEFFELEAQNSTNWIPYAGYGALAAGAGFLTAALVSDFTTPERIDALRVARDSGDPALTAQWTEYNQHVRTRSILFYISSGIFIVGGGALLTSHLAGSIETPADEITWSFEPGPMSARIHLHW